LVFETNKTDLELFIVCPAKDTKCNSQDFKDSPIIYGEVQVQNM
jgi:hypothetical protein